MYNKTTTIGATQLQDFTYTYDAVGNITDIVDAPTIYAQVTHDMTYDDLHRLTQAAATSTDANLAGTRNYTYNRLGNIITAPLGTYQYQSTAANVFSNPHAVTQIGNVTITYDKNDNMTNDGTFTHAWDFKNRMISSTSASNTISYLYDHTGNRVKKTDTISGTPTYYIDGTYEIEGTKTRHHVSAPGIGSIATVTTTTGSTTYAYHHTDHLGGTHVETDATGTLLQYMVYEPYGKIRYTYQSGTYNNDRTFTGKELDNETTLQYFGARYYSPIAGRFTSADPVFLEISTLPLDELGKFLANPQQLNSYAYAANSPYRYIDPTGAFNIESGTVEEGDTWDSIAESINGQYGTNYSTRQLQRLNNESNLSVGAILVPNQKVPDITNRLDSLMREHARDLRIHNPLYFYDKVRNGGDWDLKNTAEFDGDKYQDGFVYHGFKIRNDDPGNIHYGFVGGRAVWGGGSVLLKGAGVAQALAGTSGWGYALNNGDDRRDQLMIRWGLMMSGRNPF